MSYDANSTSSDNYLDRGSGVSSKSWCGWWRLLTYGSPSDFIRLFDALAFDEVIVGQLFSSGEINYAITNGGPSGTLVTGTNTAWIFYAVTIDTTAQNATISLRAELATSLTTITAPAGTFLNPVGEFRLMGAGFPFHQRMSAYKEWTGNITPTQFLAESGQKAPIVTSGLANYLSCDVGSTVGQDQSGNAADWTVIGTVTTNADEPVMTLPGGGGIQAAAIHYVTA